MSEATKTPELSPEQQARLREVLGGYYGYTDEWVDEVIQRMTTCHPYDDACGGRGGPCRNHGGVLAMGPLTPVSEPTCSRCGHPFDECTCDAQATR